MQSNVLTLFTILKIALCANGINFDGPLNQDQFPEDFMFGVATSAYQIEGGWNANGKGENVWDHFSHTFPDKVDDRSNGDVACDSYHRFKEDVQMLKSLGAQFYRFSLSWARILPSGLLNNVNADGIRYYNELIDELIASDITPVVTLFHFDLPQTLQEVGGWPNEVLVEYFVDFARTAFENFGDRVKIWITINEPMQMCRFGYGGGRFLAPGFNQSGLADYLCARTLIRAHVKAYHLYDQQFRPVQKGTIGYTFHSFWFEPATRGAEDVAAAERAFQFYTGIFANPIYGDGDWPKVAKLRVGAASAAQNLSFSRLPEFTPEEIQENKGTADFIGLNYYFAAMVKHEEYKDASRIDWDNDAGISYRNEMNVGYPVGPKGLRKIMKKLTDLYGNSRPIFITENGLGTPDDPDDYDRANYYLTHLSACLEAIREDNVTMMGYAAWSLMDNFEWMKGYTVRFGIYRVDFDDPARPRTRKLSGDVYEDVIKNRRLPKATIGVRSKGGSDRGRRASIVVIVVGLLCLASRHID